MVLELGGLIGLGASQPSGVLWKSLGPPSSWLSVWADWHEKHLEQAIPGPVQALYQLGTIKSEEKRQSKILAQRWAPHLNKAEESYHMSLRARVPGGFPSFLQIGTVLSPALGSFCSYLGGARDLGLRRGKSRESPISRNQDQMGN